MNEVLIELIGRLRERMPELSLIDEDYGQLETDAGDQYPVTFPCVLLSGLTVQWEEMGAMPANIQRGTAEMTASTAMTTRMPDREQRTASPTGHACSGASRIACTDTGPGDPSNLSSACGAAP